MQVGYGPSVIIDFPLTPAEEEALAEEEARREAVAKSGPVFSATDAEQLRRIAEEHRQAAAFKDRAIRTEAEWVRAQKIAGSKRSRR